MIYISLSYCVTAMSIQFFFINEQPTAESYPYRHTRSLHDALPICGFHPKHLPSPADRDAWLKEGTEAYRIYIRALLSLTDNIVDGAVVHPDHVVCGDNDDPYFVVAADKGTASFSDIANGIALERGFWLGDAFASGGSNGYDHKAMGIRSEEHTS